MTTAAAPTRDRPSTRASEHDRIVVLDGATWSDFQRLLEIRGDRPVPRFSYLEGSIQMMTPSRSHESLKSLIGSLVEAYCLERGIEFSTYGSWTLEKKDADRGLEPDECYVFGDVEEPQRPDLAIEVVWTSGGLDKLEIYRKLGVPEVWYWQKGELRAHRLKDERYSSLERSEALPEIDLDQLAGFLDVTPTSRAIREYRDALRENG